MGRSSNFGGYRGRRTLTDILRIIAVVLAVAVALLLAGLFVLQDYLVYTDDGLRVELPFFQEEPSSGENTLDPGSITVKEQGNKGLCPADGRPGWSPGTLPTAESGRMRLAVPGVVRQTGKHYRVILKKVDRLRERPAAACSSALSAFQSRKCKKQKIIPFFPRR